MRADRLDALHREDRARVREILDASAAFRQEEVEVALELFDETFAGSGKREVGGESAALPLGSIVAPPDYEFVGSFNEQNELVGYACYGPTPSSDATFDLYWIAVHPSAQGRGDGSRLIAEVERRLRERDARLLVVETSSRDSYRHTRRFYEARGYTLAARCRDFYAADDDREIYCKRLRIADCGSKASHTPRGT